MKKISRRSFLQGTAGAVTAMTLVACSDSSSTTVTADVPVTAETVETDDSGAAVAGTLKIMLRASEPTGWDAVLENFHAVTADTLNTTLEVYWVEPADYKDKLNLEMTSGADYDIVFDATWVQLNNLAPEGYYADLSEYFNNDDFIGLRDNFPDEVMNNNIKYGYKCYFPIWYALGNGLPTFIYRKDWAKEWGVGTDGEFDSMDEVEEFFAACAANGKIGQSVTASRGFYSWYRIGISATHTGAWLDGVMPFVLNTVKYWVYIKDGAVAACAIEGSGDEAFADFPEGWNYDFGIYRLKKFAEWRDLGYISADSLTITDSSAAFWAGTAAGIIETTGSYETQYSNLSVYAPEAEIGMYIHEDNVRHMKDGAYPVNYAVNNGLCIPVSSKNIPRAMTFLDWMFQSQENHDLIEYGREDIDYTAIGDSQYTAITQYPDVFPGYVLTWNPNFVRYPDTNPDWLMEYNLYEMSEESLASEPICGFSFNGTSTEMATYCAQLTAINDPVNTCLQHGIISDGTNMYDSVKECLAVVTANVLANGGQEVMDELILQLNEHLASQV